VRERLLASPAYGEKWGREWLDVVRYADTAGENTDRPLPHAWRYRNWVIDAFNKDQPYDEFIRWQLAGDLLAPQGPAEQAADKIVAIGETEILDVAHLASVIHRYLAKDTIEITVLRGDERKTVAAQLVSPPPPAKSEGGKAKADKGKKPAEPKPGQPKRPEPARPPL